jgi:hypothetical protein
VHDQARPVGMLTVDLNRAVGAVALVVVAVIHVVDLPGTLSETPLIGYGYYVLVGVALLGAFLLVTVPDRWVWALVDLTAFGAVAANVLSRTSGLPTDSVDIGNWSCPLGIAALSTESLVSVIAMWQLQSPRPLRSAATPRQASDTPVTHPTGRDLPDRHRRADIRPYRDRGGYAR